MDSLLSYLTAYCLEQSKGESMEFDFLTKKTSANEPSPNFFTFSYLDLKSFRTTYKLIALITSLMIYCYSPPSLLNVIEYSPFCSLKLFTFIFSSSQYLIESIAKSISSICETFLSPNSPYYSIITIKFWDMQMSNNPSFNTTFPYLAFTKREASSSMDACWKSSCSCKDGSLK